MCFVVVESEARAREVTSYRNRERRAATVATSVPGFGRANVEYGGWISP